jgi:hypothetical protein
MILMYYGLELRTTANPFAVQEIADTLKELKNCFKTQ